MTTPQTVTVLTGTPPDRVAATLPPAPPRVRRRRNLVAWARPRWIVEERRVLIVGTGPIALRVLDALGSDDTTLFQIVGFVDTGAPVSDAAQNRTLGTLADLESILMREHVDEVFVALPVKSHYREIQEALSTCERIGVSAKYRAHVFRADVAWPLCEPGADPVVTMQVTRSGYQAVVKRILDAVAAAMLLAALAPLLATVALAIKWSSPGPILYAQQRYGLNRRRFRMLKFRTMVTNAESLQASLEQLNEADGPVFKITNDPRVTRLGRLLRRTSIDELPQLWNVLRGDMSLVGPRPLPLRDVARFPDPCDMRRFSVRPGLTCLWQISGRSQLSFSDWMRLDLAYVDHWSLGLDLLILIRTVPAILRGTGAY